jgi:hypothetical protein
MQWRNQTTPSERLYHAVEEPDDSFREVALYNLSEGVVWFLHCIVQPL